MDTKIYRYIHTHKKKPSKEPKKKGKSLSINLSSASERTYSFYTGLARPVLGQPLACKTK